MSDTSGLVYLGTLAKTLKLETRKLRRLIKKLEEKHQTHIITRPNTKSHYLVDLTILNQIEPAIFAHVTLRSIEADELHDRLDSLESRVKRLE